MAEDITIGPEDFDGEKILEEEMKLLGLWGVYDTKDNVWLGGEKGPKVFVNKALARIAAQVYAMQIYGSELETRLEARELPHCEWTKRDDVKVKYDTETALRRCEGDYSETPTKED